MAQIHGHVEDLAGDDPDQLALRILLLIMQAPEHAPAGHGLIVLNEDHIQACLMHVVQIVGLHEIAAAVSEYGRLDDHQALDLTACDFDFTHSFHAPIVLSSDPCV